MAGRWVHAGLTLLFLIALGLRLGYAILASDPARSLPPRGYAREYITAGTRILEHGTLTSPLILDDADHNPSALMPPVYAGLVAGTFRLLGIESRASLFVLYSINALATSLCVLCVFWMARRLGGEIAAWLAALLVTINPLLIGFTSYIWDTNLFCLGVTVAGMISIRLKAKPAGLAVWLGFGVYLGALALLNPALTITYPLLVLWPLSQTYGWRVKRIAGPVIVTVLGWALIITPWTVRNYSHFDRLIYVRYGFMIELWLGVCPEADGEASTVYKRRFPLLNDDVQERIAEIGERGFIEECGVRASEAIKEDPQRFVRLIAKRVSDYHVGTIYSHVSPGQPGWPNTTVRFLISSFLAAEFVAVVFLMAWRRSRVVDVWWILGIAASFSVVYCLTHIFVRFRAPTEPLLDVAVAVLLAGFLRFGRTTPTTTKNPAITRLR